MWGDEVYNHGIFNGFSVYKLSGLCEKPAKLSRDVHSFEQWSFFFVDDALQWGMSHMYVYDRVFYEGNEKASKC